MLFEIKLFFTQSFFSSFFIYFFASCNFYLRRKERVVLSRPGLSKGKKNLQFNIQGPSYFASGVVHDLIFIAPKKYRQIELNIGKNYEDFAYQK
jgi:hypothetical protein